ncbi:MAG: hypothetical protein WB677_09085 [Xanthobacteraceae bacterium]
MARLINLKLLADFFNKIGQQATSVREAGMGGVGIAGGCELSASKGRKARKLPKLRGKAT